MAICAVTKSRCDLEAIAFATTILSLVPNVFL
jgi:hypothetical protein